MTTIFKYKLHAEFGTVQEIKLAMGATPLEIAWQDGSLVMWILTTDDTKGLESRYFTVYATGSDISYSNLTYIGTAQTETGNDKFKFLVFHVFEIVPDDMPEAS